MPKQSKEFLISEFNKKVSDYNRKYNTSLKTKDIEDMVKELNNFDMYARSSLRIMSLSSYKKQYKKIFTECLRNENVQTDADAVKELVEIMDTAPYYLSDFVESMKDHPNTVTNFEIGVGADGKFVSNMPIEEEFSNGKYSAEAGRQVYLKEYNSVHEWIETLEKFNSKDDPTVKNEKTVAMPSYGLMSVRERKELFSSVISEEVKQQHYQKNVIKSGLEYSHEYHYENIAENARRMMNTLGIDQNSSQEEKDRLIWNVGQYIQTLMDKRSGRGFFGVLFHPFRSHGETKTIKELTNELANQVGMDAHQLKRDLQNGTIEIYDYRISNVKNAIIAKAETNKEESLKKFDEIERDLEAKNNKAIDDFPEYEKMKAKIEQQKKELADMEKAYDDNYNRKNIEVKPEEIEEKIDVNNAEQKNEDEKVIDIEVPQKK